MRADRFARAVDDRVVVVQDGCDVGSSEDDAELERELLAVAARGELAGVLRVACGFEEELTPLPLVQGDAIAYQSVPAPISAEAVTKKQLPGKMRCST